LISHVSGKDDEKPEGGEETDTQEEEESGNAENEHHKEFSSEVNNRFTTFLLQRSLSEESKYYPIRTGKEEHNESKFYSEEERLN
jgi:hypothetical protein